MVFLCVAGLGAHTLIRAAVPVLLSETRLVSVSATKGAVSESISDTPTGSFQPFNGDVTAAPAGPGGGTAFATAQQVSVITPNLIMANTHAFAAAFQQTSSDIREAAAASTLQVQFSVPETMAYNLVGFLNGNGRSGMPFTTLVGTSGLIFEWYGQQRSQFVAPGATVTNDTFGNVTATGLLPAGTYTLNMVASVEFDIPIIIGLPNMGEQGFKRLNLELGIRHVPDSGTPIVLFGAVIAVFVAAAGRAQRVNNKVR
jgi:hypothetical protein